MTELNAIEIRVLGCLIEKELGTPDAYPLSLSALTAACNQKSSRDPVMNLDEAGVLDAVNALMRRHLVRERGGAGSRVTKYAHRLASTLDDAAELSRPQLALLGVLLLRGPQTLGELRTRAARLCDFDSLAAVEGTLQELASREPEPYVAELPRAPGQRERRFMHLLGGEVPEMAVAPVAADSEREGGRLELLEAEVAALRADVAELRDRVASLVGRAGGE